MVSVFSPVITAVQIDAAQSSIYYTHAWDLGTLNSIHHCYITSNTWAGQDSWGLGSLREPSFEMAQMLGLYIEDYI